MMMEKPRSESSEEAPVVKPKGASDQVANLERRLAMLGGGSTAEDDPPPSFAVAEEQQEQQQSFAAPTAASAPTAAPAASGKNALLARIKAAQERAKQQPHQAKAKAETEHSPPDFFSMETPSQQSAPAPPPSFDSMSAASPPPAFDSMDLSPPQPEEAPPSFDTVEGSLKPPAENYDPPPQFDPMAAPAPAMVPSAPAFEDLLSDTPSSAPPAFEGMETLQPPSQQQQSSHPQAFSEEFAGLEGLSEEEKHALLEEQRRIMEAIERNKTGNNASAAVAAAEAFDQRSNAAVAKIAGAADGSSSNRTVALGGNQEVALHGQERTQKAIADGTAILVECVNCSNWMQVTDNASLMFCPVCQVVSPVDRENALKTKEEVLQLEADRKLAEELQNEEYSAVERAERAEERRKKREQKAREAAAQQGQSWWDWLGLGSSTETGPEAQQTAPQYRGDLGASRPPGAATLSSAQTGEINYANSGSFDREDRPLMRGPNGARVAEAKPLFACVADSISTAANTLYTQTFETDEEGNVHGVDSSSLLAMSNAGRGNQSSGGYD